MIMTTPLFIKKWVKRVSRKVILTKRQEFVGATGVLVLGLILTQLVPLDFRYPMVVFLALLAFTVSAIVLRYDLGGIEWLTLLVLPTLFTTAVSLFYFLLPVRWATRLPVAALYGVGMYALLLTENIFNVAAERGIGLLRAAHSVGFLVTLVTYFLLILTIFSFRLPVFITALLIASVNALLFLQSLWSHELGKTISVKAGEIVVILTVLSFELTWALLFWPIKPILLALLLTSGFYSMAGMAQQYMVEKLYKKTIIEFVSVLCIVFVLAIITARWRGPV